MIRIAITSEAFERPRGPSESYSDFAARRAAPLPKLKLANTASASQSHSPGSGLPRSEHRRLRVLPPIGFPAHAAAEGYPCSEVVQAGYRPSGRLPEKFTPRDLRALTPLIWEHVNPYGRFELDMDARLPID